MAALRINHFFSLRFCSYVLWINSLPVSIIVLTNNFMSRWAFLFFYHLLLLDLYLVLWSGLLLHIAFSEHDLAAIAIIWLAKVISTFLTTNLRRILENITSQWTHILLTLFLKFIGYFNPLFQGRTIFTSYNNVKLLFSLISFWPFAKGVDGSIEFFVLNSILLNLLLMFTNSL